MSSFASSALKKDNAAAPIAVVVTPVVKGLAGSLGGTVEACFLQPIDVIKTRIQLDSVGKYKGIANCGNTIIREEGVKALWKGLTPFATHLTLKYALRMGTNATFQSFLRDKNGTLTSQSRMLAGFGAGVTEALVVVTPFEVVKIKLQQQKGCAVSGFKYKGPIHCATTIVRESGPQGLWAGCTPTVMRNGTNQMCLFYMKNVFDVFFWDKHEGDGRVLAPWQSMISGFSAAFAGPIATGPFDVAKTRMMAQEKAACGSKPYNGFFHCIMKVASEEGVLALYKGLLPRLMRIPPGQAITWAVADQLVGLYEKTYSNLRHN
mmetsp:Transcript_23908/g.32884  ORF Transcript_23908/g.32884 Transcript_23908/m.32884 type:complete len:320 (-) Transcript_23908:131-1090(-)|eukprot:CAMPEP_0196592544 /NCGR_PEP_ID=MMETSP1081-20130531/73054_1 /TAXON_ID=36882 /ORGANISM="Pyramimonas amylifera, Strain CCMP720" /LENGTH=319 /DNA_ID=CAMNT_0041916271 /DNA_START=160 /DNA_END=1119 /DNA_ORIENTATION=-